MVVDLAGPIQVRKKPFRGPMPMVNPRKNDMAGKTPMLTGI